MRRRFYRQKALRTGLALVLVPFASTLVFSVLEDMFGGVPSSLGLYYFFAAAAFAVVGFSLLITSLFLPSRPEEKPTFTEELLGKEKLQYGSFTEGNWKAVLDEEDRRETEKHDQATSQPES